MAADEIFVAILACIVGPVFWLVRLRLWTNFQQPGAAQRTIAGTLVICGVLWTAVLTTVASSDVVNAPVFIFVYTVLGYAWINLAEQGFAFAGVSLRDDGIERRNAAARVAAAGALMGVALCYAGANVGEGPGWLVVLFSAALATAGWFVCWLALGLLTPVNDAVTIDRDPAAGIRLGAFLIACGIVAGRAVAGDWESVRQTLWDFGEALAPLAFLLVAAIFVERAARPTPRRPFAPPLPLGVLPAMMYLAIACAGAAWLGRLE